MKFIKKFFIIIVAIICIGFFFIYRQYNINKLEKIRENQALFNSWSKNEIVCSTDYEPVCWVDNKEYSNKCIAEKINSVEIKNTWKCKNKELTSSNDLPENIWEHNLGETEENSTWITSTWTDLNENTEDNTEEIKTDPEYYKNLKSQCWEDGCCLDSVDNMEKWDYSEAINDLCPTWYKIETLKCSTSYKWCTKDTSVNTSNSDNTNSWSWSKTLNYENSNFNYWFSLPKNTYFAWYWANSWANHTVWISTNSWTTTFDENEVKVYYYKWKILDELKNTKKYIDDNNWKIYLELNWNSVVIESKSWNEKIINSIIDTVYQK